jgi:septum formation protein
MVMSADPQEPSKASLSFAWRDSRPLALASKSAGRRLVLEQAGVPFAICPTDVDERALEAAILGQGGGADDVVLRLAEEKALRVSRELPDQWVLGADQAASCDGRIFGKPADRGAAAAQLRLLSGRRHRLHSGLALARAGVIRFSIVRHADIKMRPLSEPFIDAYLDAMGDKVLSSAGAYQVEGLGAYLFSAVDGDHWTIMGLPLLDALDALRRFEAVLG